MVRTITAVVIVFRTRRPRCPRGQLLGRGPGGVGTHHQQGASREQRAGADRRPRPEGKGPCLGSRRGQPHPAATAPRPGGRPWPGNTHLRRSHPARPVRSSGNSARLLPRPPVPGRGRRPERTNQRRPPILAANGCLPSERSEGSLRRTSVSPLYAQWSDLTRSKWRRAEPLRGCAGERTGSWAGAGSKSQMTGFGGLRSASRKAGSLGGQRGGREHTLAQLPSQKDALTPGGGP